MGAWAKFPTAWLSLVAAIEDAPPPLRELDWRGHRTSAVAALILLMALAIRLNQSRKGRELQAGIENVVSVTWDDLQQMSGFARATVGKGLSLLEAIGAIKTEKKGRSSYYELNGVGTRGGWCQLPQDELLSADGTLTHLKGVTTNRVVLNAMKIYVLLMALRNQRFNTTSVSYEGICKRTGIRRADVSSALGYLTALELIGVSEDLDARKEDMSRRYKINGLTSIG